MNPRRAPFAIDVTLPGGRAYHAQAELAVMLGPAGGGNPDDGSPDGGNPGGGNPDGGNPDGGNPDRLTVQLPPDDLATTARLLGEYAAQWGFPASAVAAWHSSAARRPPGDRHYSTHVFTAADAGFVHLEFQVSHHVRERDYVVTALFSWPGRT